MEPLGFGGKITDADPRNYDLHKINQNIGADVPLPPSTSNDYSSIPVDMQGTQPACGAHAGAFLKNVLSYQKSGGRLHSSPRYNWTEIKTIDGFPIDDGTDINSIFTSMRTKGVCSFDLAGNDVTLSEQDYANLPITPAMTVDALNNQTQAEAYIYNPTWEQICQTIQLHGACIGLLRVGVNMYQPSWAEKDILPLNPNKPMSSGHFITFINYDENYIYFRNHWSTAWGRNGDGYIARDYIPYVVAIGTAVDKELITPDVIPAAVIVNGQVTNWYQRWVYLLKSLGLYGK